MNVSNAQIHGASALLLAEALKLNNTLAFINLSDNNMGTRGAQALLIALTGHGTIKKSIATNITAESVPIPGMKDAVSHYDPLNPDGKHRYCTAPVMAGNKPFCLTNVCAIGLD